MRGIFSGAGDVDNPSFPVDSAGGPRGLGYYHVYVSGTFSGGARCQVEISPDSEQVDDSVSRWFTQSTLGFTAEGHIWFSARFRKVRFTKTGGDGSTNITMEIV